MTSETIVYTYMNSPLGKILMVKNSVGLISINFQEGLNSQSPAPEWHFNQEAFEAATTQLRAYFNGELYQFDLPLAPKGTPFQLEVWQALQQIPYGETISYAVLANSIGRPKAVRAVGAANGMNPLPIVIPCHRVIGSNGKLTGYAGGVHLKEALLAHERNDRSKSNL